MSIVASKNFLIFGGLFILAAIVGFAIANNLNKKNAAPAGNSVKESQTLTVSVSPSVSASPSAAPSVVSQLLTSPIDRWSERLTKKPFGIYITPQNSPVQPERFIGFHTGVDFETFPEEQNIDVTIYAICTGALLLKESASGYGGVAVQTCKLNGQDIIVIYGHLKLDSISAQKNQTLSAGQQLGILGKGFSPETDGERKHLHLGIHKGKSVNILGYVGHSVDLANWLDITKYLPN